MGDYVFYAGDTGTKMYFVKRGAAVVLDPGGEADRSAGSKNDAKTQTTWLSTTQRDGTAIGPLQCTECQTWYNWQDIVECGMCNVNGNHARVRVAGTKCNKTVCRNCMEYEHDYDEVTPPVVVACHECRLKLKELIENMEEERDRTTGTETASGSSGDNSETMRELTL